MGNGQPMQVKPAAADDLDIPEALRRTPKPAPAATADIPPDIDVDPELNDEITI